MAAISALKIVDVCLSFGGNRVLSNVSLSINDGELFSLIGPNGAGKTSLINVLTRHYEAQGGQAAFFGSDLFAKRPHELARAGIARTFQNVLLLKDMSVLENVLLGLHSSFATNYLSTAVGRERSEDRLMRERAFDALELVGLQSYCNLQAGSLPLGHQRLLELARCVVNRPRLMFLDEPSAGMSSEEVERLTETIRSIRQRLSPTIILVAHTMKLVMNLSDQIAVLDHGVKIASGPPKVVVEDPAVIAAYLGGSN